MEAKTIDPRVEPLIGELTTTGKFFTKTAECLEEQDSSFAPKPGMFTVAQHVAHAAQAIDWFLEGAFRPEGMSTDFEGNEKIVRRVTSLAEARAWLDRSVASATARLKAASSADLDQPIQGPIMAGMPRSAVISAITDHTSHHRGALSVYARLLGKVPAMPYD
jgi:uncharacterized damage-inducible protein DinB